MASVQFYERFKDKISRIPRQGALTVNKQHTAHSPNSPLKKSARQVLKHSSGPKHQSMSTPRNFELTRQSDAQTEPEWPLRARDRHTARQRRPFALSAQPHSQPCQVLREGLVGYTDYTPYSLTEYRNIAPTQYYTLGGLGPSYVGTQEWTSEYARRKRRDNYVKNSPVVGLRLSYAAAGDRANWPAKG